MAQLRLALCLLFVLCLPLHAKAQVDRANLAGTVADASGAVVPDAEVELSSTDTGLRRTARSDTDGRYRFAAVPPGSYVLSVTKAGFAPAAFADVQLAVGQSRTLDVSLAIGGLNEAVNVTASAAALDRSSPEIGAVISSELIEKTPLNGRNWASLMAFAPGAVNTSDGGQGSIRFFGRARDDNNWTFDGVDATGVKDPRTEASLRLVMSSEAIAEFRVSSTGYTADAGTGAGGQVNLVSKSGTNQFRGSLFTYLRDDALDERRVLDPLPEEPAFRLYQSGVTLGGPIARNRTFFFGTYEGLRQRQDVANERPSLVPSAAFRALVQATQPALVPVMNAYPLGTSPTADPNIDEYRGRRELTWNEDSFLIRVDHRFSDATTLVGRWNGVDGLIDSEVRSDLLETRRSESFPMNATGQLQHVFSPSLIGEVKVGWNRSPLERTDQGLGAEGFEIQRAFTATRATLFNEEKPQSLSYLGNVVMTRGRHTVKVGGEFRQIQINVGNSAATSVRWGSIADFLANRTNRVRVDGELPLQEGRRWYGIGYGQTEWRATADLTINAGVRYEYYSVMTEANGRGNVIDLERCPPTAESIYCAPGTPWYFPDKNNVAPRLGAAWTLGPNTVVRAGYGVYFSPGQNDDVTAAFDSLAVRGDLTTVAAFPVEDDVPAALARANSRPRALQRDRDDMYAQVYSATVQRQLPGALVAQVGYVGSRGRNVFNRIFINTIDPVSGVRPAAPFLTQQIDRKGNLGRTEYDALQLSLQRPFSGGFLLQGNYTLGRSRDNNAGNGEGSEWQDARCGACEWGPSDFDARHIASVNTVYQLPFGRGRRYVNGGVAGALLGNWDLAGVLFARSGRPINVLIERVGPDGNDVNQRPDLVPGVNPVLGTAPNAWLNPAAFATPAPGTFGNAPRNGFRGPGAWQIDLSLTRRIVLPRQASVDLRIDGFNILNIDQYGNPARVITQPLTFGLLSPLNSSPTGTGTARQFQVSARLNF